MKKLISLLLVLVMALSLAACNNSDAGETTATTTAPTTEPTTAPTTEPVVTGPASALELMNTVWTTWNNEYADYFMGGGYANPVTAAPGAIASTETDSLQGLLYVPEANLADIQSAASVMNAMNANNFTAYALQTADPATLAATMQNALQNNQWMCGFPEGLIVYTLADYVVIAFGASDNLDGFRTAVTTAYPEIVNLYDGIMG